MLSRIKSLLAAYGGTKPLGGVYSFNLSPISIVQYSTYYYTVIYTYIMYTEYTLYCRMLNSDWPGSVDSFHITAACQLQGLHSYSHSNTLLFL